MYKDFTVLPAGVAPSGPNWGIAGMCAVGDNVFIAYQRETFAKFTRSGRVRRNGAIVHVAKGDKVPSFGPGSDPEKCGPGIYDNRFILPPESDEVVEADEAGDGVDDSDAELAEPEPETDSDLGFE